MNIFLKSVSTTIALVAGCSLSHAASLWQDTLKPRDINGDGIVDAYFDTALNISWLADVANGGEPQGAASASWEEANRWASTLNVFGVSGWRLPNTRPVNGNSFQLKVSFDGSTDLGEALPGQGWGTASELGHMFYVTLGNAGCSQLCDPRDLRNTEGPFHNMLTSTNFEYNRIWTGSTVDAPLFTNAAFYFNLSFGSQSASEKGELLRRGWAVIDGDVPNVAAIPEPSAGVLLLIGLGAGAARFVNRKRQ